jgi:hypothetical protein
MQLQWIGPEDYGMYKEPMASAYLCGSWLYFSWR